MLNFLIFCMANFNPFSHKSDIACFFADHRKSVINHSDLRLCLLLISPTRLRRLTSKANGPAQNRRWRWRWFWLLSMAGLHSNRIFQVKLSLFCLVFVSMMSCVVPLIYFTFQVLSIFLSNFAASHQPALAFFASFSSLSPFLTKKIS